LSMDMNAARMSAPWLTEVTCTVHHRYGQGKLFSAERTSMRAAGTRSSRT